MRFNHIGIPTTRSFDDEIHLPHLKMTVSDHQDNQFGIQWQRYWDDDVCSCVARDCWTLRAVCAAQGSRQSTADTFASA
jgi:hypothetical protein